MMMTIFLEWVVYPAAFILVTLAYVLWFASIGK